MLARCLLPLSSIPVGAYSETTCTRVNSHVRIPTCCAAGTAIVAGAGLLNALELVHKNIEDVTVCICGVGAAGFTCAKYFRSLGVQKENLICVDVQVGSGGAGRAWVCLGACL